MHQEKSVALLGKMQQPCLSLNTQFFWEEDSFLLVRPGKTCRLCGHISLLGKGKFDKLIRLLFLSWSFRPEGSLELHVPASRLQLVSMLFHHSLKKGLTSTCYLKKWCHFRRLCLRASVVLYLLPQLSSGLLCCMQNKLLSIYQIWCYVWLRPNSLLLYHQNS